MGIGWLETLFLLAWVPLVVVVHEAGHALMARPAGFRLTSFRVGRGRPLLRVQAPAGWVFAVGRLFFAGGACVAIPSPTDSGGRAALYHGGGALAQAVLGAALLLAPDWWWVEPVARFNLLVLAWNLLPWRVRGHASDGWWLLGSARGLAGAGPLLFAWRPLIRRLQAFEREVESPLGAEWTGLLLAWMDLQVGRLDDADGWFAEGPPAREPTGLAQVLRGEWHRHHKRPLAAVRIARGLDAADPTVTDLAVIVEARALLDLDEPRAARQVLARLAGVGGPAGHEGAAVLLEAALADGDAAEIRRSARRLRDRLRGPFLDPVLAVRAAWDASRVLGEQGDLALADELERGARAGARRLLAASMPADRAALLRRIGEAAGLRRPEPVTEREG